VSKNLKIVALGCILSLSSWALHEWSFSIRRLAQLVVAEAESASAVPPIVACSPDTPTVRLGETVVVRAWARLASGEPLKYIWTSTVGRFVGEGSEARWDFSGVDPGFHTATVRVSVRKGGSATCSITVRLRLGKKGPARFTGRTLLVKGHKEVKGYGLYSYLLFGSRPNEDTRERYSEAITAYLNLIEDIRSFQKNLPLSKMNITYVPVEEDMPGYIGDKQQDARRWILEHYDYASAQVLLGTLPGTHRDGPYIVSYTMPISSNISLSRQYLYQDLSSVPPHLVSLWVKEFLNQAEQERFWEKRTGAQFVLGLRKTIGILAVGLPITRDALDNWIVWTKSLSTS
jgi:hypothetical protein